MSLRSRSQKIEGNEKYEREQGLPVCGVVYRCFTAVVISRRGTFPLPSSESGGVVGEGTGNVLL